MTDVALEAGNVLGERYRLRRSLGEGSMGFVWEATEVSTDKAVALKVLKSAKEEDRKRFLREMRAAAAIRQANVIDVRDCIELPDGRLVLVMELLEGETLGAVLAREERISLRALAAVILPVLSALEAAHALGIVHRDLKPDNIFLCGTGDRRVVKVLDFGVVKLTAEEGAAARTQALTGTGARVGTPFYMSPEQVFAEQDLDARADVWALGIVMYECLSGRKPTQADTMGRVLKKIMAADFEAITAHCKDLPEDVTSLIGRMLSVDRDARPRSLSEIRAVLARHVDEPAVATRSRRRPVVAAATAVVALVGVAAYVRAPMSPTAVTIAAPSSAPAVVVALPAASAVPSPLASALTSSAPPAVPTARPSATPTPVPAQAAAKPTCEKHEVLSEGHCCPLGQQWRGERCERPLATTF